MQPSIYSPEEVVKRGKRLYEERVKSQVEPQHLGKFLALDVDTGHYALGDDSQTALHSARTQWPDAPLFLIRVGFPTAVKLGGRIRVGIR